ncbi:flagellar motor switch protein FliM [Angustibacter peucedani]
MPSNDSAETGTGRAPATAEPQPYDFRRPTKLAREHSRLLEMVYETVARQWATVLGSELGSQCQVVFAGVEQRSYDDYVSSLPSPNLLAVFQPEPHTGAGFLQISPETGFTTIERMLGGQGSGEQPSRVLTEIETQLVVRVVERLLGELRYGLAAVAEVRPALKALEFNPQFVQVAAATDLYIVATFTMTIGEFSAPATVALPAPVLAVRSTDAGQDDPVVRAARARARSTMSTLVEDVPVEVSVRFVPRTLPSTQLLNLREGDVVRLDHPVDRPLDVVSAGVVCARGVAGAQGPRAACLITASLPGRASE